MQVIDELVNALREIYDLWDNAEDLQTIRVMKNAAFIAQEALAKYEAAMKLREQVREELAEKYNWDMPGFDACVESEAAERETKELGCLNCLGMEADLHELIRVALENPAGLNGFITDNYPVEYEAAVKTDVDVLVIKEIYCQCGNTIRIQAPTHTIRK